MSSNKCWSNEQIHSLVVDGNEFMRALIRQVLRSLGVREIKEACDAIEAMRILEAVSPDLIIVACEMEPIDGMEFTRRIRKFERGIDRTVPIIAHSACAQRSQVYAARNAGVNEFLVQPISVTALESRMTAVLERPRPFVVTDVYVGPCRRRTDQPFGGVERRARKNRGAEDVSTLMSQGEINALMNPREAPADAKP